MFVMAQSASTGNEKKFIDRFIEAIEVKSEGKIVCKSADYHMDNLTPSFILTVHDVFQLEFERSVERNSACNGYNISGDVQSVFLSFGNNAYFNDEALRCWQYSIIGNSYSLLFELGGELAIMETAPNVSFLTVKESGIRGVTSAQIDSSSFPTNPYFNLMNDEYEVLHSQYPLHARSNLDYNSTEPKKIQLSNSKRLYDDNGHFERNILSLKDCMYVPARKNFITADKKEYFCVCEGNLNSDPPLSSTVLEVT